MALVFYRGLGFLPIAFLILSGLVATILGFDRHDHSWEGLGITAAGVLTGVACAVLKFRDSRSGHGSLKLLSTQHTLMFIPVVFWGPILVIMGLCKM